jgi:hypothetical protein
MLKYLVRTAVGVAIVASLSSVSAHASPGLVLTPPSANIAGLILTIPPE